MIYSLFLKLYTLNNHGVGSIMYTYLQSVTNVMLTTEIRNYKREPVKKSLRISTCYKHLTNIPLYTVRLKDLLKSCTHDSIINMHRFSQFYVRMFVCRIATFRLM